MYLKGSSATGIKVVSLKIINRVGLVFNLVELLLKLKQLLYEKIPSINIAMNFKFILRPLDIFGSGRRKL